MKRALMVGAGTAVGLSAALSYTPRMALPEVSAAAGVAPVTTASAPTDAALTAPSAPAATAVATTGAAAAATAPTPTTPAAPSGTFTGPVVSTRFGDVQVAVTVTAGRLTDVTALAFPSADSKSATLSSQAIQVLREEALVAQSAEVSAVSGATYTSQAWRESVAAALAQAGL